MSNPYLNQIPNYSIDAEIIESNNKLNELRLNLKGLNEQKNGVSGIDMEILIEEIIGLETMIDSETTKYNNLIQCREYQVSCDHCFVDDLIDITPDKSKVIKYCVVCLFTSEN